jgi:hypothetical protein
LYPSNAKNVIILLIDIHYGHVDGTNFCHNLSKDALTDIFQVQLSIDKMNENRIHVETDFGVLVCDACSDEYVSKISFATSIKIVNESNLNLIAIFTSITSASFYEINKIYKEYNENSNEEYYDIFERVKKTDKNDIFSKYIGKNRMYVYFLLRLFNPFSKIILQSSNLSNILKYRVDKRVIYIFYDMS